MEISSLNGTPSSTEKNRRYKTLSLKIHNVLLPFQRLFSDVLDICNILKGFDFVL